MEVLLGANANPGPLTSVTRRLLKEHAMKNPESIQEKAEKGILFTQEFLVHLQERLTYFENQGDGERSAAVKHIMVGVTKFLEMEKHIASKKENEN